MLTKIEDLASVSEGQSKDKLAAVAKKELEQEEELHDTLKELQEVAKEIELVASTDGGSNTETIEKMAQALQAASEKIRGVEESIGKEKKTEDEEDALDNHVVKEEEESKEKEEEDGEKAKDEKAKDEKAKEEKAKEEKVKELKVQEGRKGKGLLDEDEEDEEDEKENEKEDEKEDEKKDEKEDEKKDKDAFEDADVVVDEADSEDAAPKVVDDSEGEEAASKVDKERKGKAAEDDEGASVEVRAVEAVKAVEVTTPAPPKETCEQKTASNKVQVSLFLYAIPSSRGGPCD
jgi:hypothetical protein